MRRRLKWLAGLMVLAAFFTAACADGGTIDKPDPSEELQSEEGHADDITLTIDGGTFIPDVTRSLHFDYTEGITILQALESSGIVELTKDKGKIQSVGEVSLDSTLEWGIRLNDKELPSRDWDKQLKAGDNILVCVKTAGSATAGQNGASLLLTVNGGSQNPQLKSYFVHQYNENTTVRDLLKHSGIVELNKTGQHIVSVNGYRPDETEAWVLKVNHKKLLDTGLDMRLKPQDNVEIALVRK
ncbi:hypothetical protein ABEO75_15830 [Paenibacillus macerans]|uniref:hypothetical protein n=1 Tax=Paenibacillus macerans TaxID=44252 RepID=UPI002E1DA832|nr:hypothetical protein [Paenibacillus macerans]